MNGHRLRPNGRLVAGAIATLVLAGCFSSGPHPSGTVDPHQPATVEFADTVFEARQPIDIPGTDLTLIGQATRVEWQHAADRSVYAIRDVDPAQVIALEVSAEGLAAQTDPDAPDREPWPHWLFMSAVIEALPDALCRYYDPRSERSPTECQGPITVRFGGSEYRYVRPPEPVYFQIPPTELSVLGTGDIDPRVPAAHDGRIYGVRGIDPRTVVVLVAPEDTGTTYDFVVFLALDHQDPPADICRFLIPWDPNAPPIACPGFAITSNP